MLLHRRYAIAASAAHPLSPSGRDSLEGVERDPVRFVGAVELVIARGELEAPEHAADGHEDCLGAKDLAVELIAERDYEGIETGNFQQSRSFRIVVQAVFQNRVSKLPEKTFQMYAGAGS